METSEGDELPRVSKLTQVFDERAHLSVGHTRGIPVERRGQVV